MTLLNNLLEYINFINQQENHYKTLTFNIKLQEEKIFHRLINKKNLLN